MLELAQPLKFQRSSFNVVGDTNERSGFQSDWVPMGSDAISSDHDQRCQAENANYCSRGACVRHEHPSLWQCCIT